MSPHVTQAVPPPVSAQVMPAVSSLPPPGLHVPKFCLRSQGTPLLATIQKLSLSPLAFTVSFTRRSAFQSFLD